jgi:membrane protease subunit HflK
MNPPVPRPPAAAEDVPAQALNDALGSAMRVLRVLMLVVLASVLFSGVFTVQPNEVAVVLRFGKATGTGAGQLREPGLHWAFPYPIDEIVRLRVGQSQLVTSSTGWYYATAAEAAAGIEPPARGTLTPGVDGYLICADGNLIHARATLRYRISDPVRHAFHFGSASNLLQNLLNRALLEAAAEFPADAAIYRDKLGFKDAVLASLGASLAEHQPGVALDPFEVEVMAPLDVRPAFEAVIAAEQERSRRMNDARASAHEILLTAGGDAQAVLSAGRSASHQLTTAVAAEAISFTEQRPHFDRHPELFVRRRLIETVAVVLTNAQDKFVLPVHEGGPPSQLRLQLGREPAKPAGRSAANP